MKIEVEIENPQDLNETFVETFKSFTETKKEELTEKIWHEWFKSKKNFTGEELQGIICAELREEIPEQTSRIGGWNGPTKKISEMTNEEMVQTEPYKNRHTNYKTPKELFYNKVTVAVAQSFQEKVNNEIRTNPRIQKMFDEAFEQIQKDFPAFVQKAMIAYFATNMGQIAQNMASVNFLSNDLESLTNNLQNKLNLGNVY